MSLSSLLLLTDARFPDGTHAHSYGLEAAVTHGRVHDDTTLHAYLRARLWTTGRIEAGAAVLAARGAEPPEVIDAELALRTPSAVARQTSRSLGRSLTRTASRLWPDSPVPRVHGRSPMQPVVLGRVATLAGCSPSEAGLCVTHGLAGGMATAALRLLGMDPFTVTAVLHELRDDVALSAASVEDVDEAADLPDASTPFAELDP
ncbi:MAG: urease accessory protein UreF, partial [Microthrixaceae bacterium]